MNDNETRGRLVAQVFYEELEKIARALAPFKSMAGHALMGAGAGGVIGGATAGEGNRMSGAAMGAGMGAAMGAGVGHLGMRAAQSSGVRKGILNKTDDAGRAAFKAAPEKLEEQVAAGVKTHRDGAKTFADRYGYKPLVRDAEKAVDPVK